MATSGSAASVRALPNSSRADTVNANTRPEVTGEGGGMTTVPRGEVGAVATAPTAGEAAIGAAARVTAREKAAERVNAAKTS